MPVNIGIDNLNLDKSVSDYNKLIVDLNKLQAKTGSSNSIVRNLKSEIKLLSENIRKIILNYQKELEIKINNLLLNEKNYTKDFSNIPKNEKLLRDINREQEIKEALFLLLLQKREEAAINFAVTKPSIKIVDYASTNFSPVSPNTFLIYMLAFLLGIGIPL